jgi:hypothetical protein
MARVRVRRGKSKNPPPYTPRNSVRFGDLSIGDRFHTERDLCGTRSRPFTLWIKMEDYAYSSVSNPEAGWAINPDTLVFHYTGPV